MFRITYVLGGDEAYRDRARKILLATLTLIDKSYIRNTPSAKNPRSLKFEEEGPGLDDWRDASALNVLGQGDCEDIACYTAAWLQAKHGLQAWPQLVTDASSGCTHVVVEVAMPDGTKRTLDPSIQAGRDPHTAAHECTAHAKYLPEEKITIVTDIFSSETRVTAGVKNVPITQQLAHRSLSLLLHALFLIDVLYLRLHPDTPSIYAAGVRYEEEPPGREDWQDIPTTIRRKDGDCEDLATWRSAELVAQRGIEARPSFLWRLNGGSSYLYHIQTEYPDGRIEDPSRALGMGASHTS